MTTDFKLEQWVTWGNRVISVDRNEECEDFISQSRKLDREQKCRGTTQQGCPKHRRNAYLKSLDKYASYSGLDILLLFEA